MSETASGTERSARPLAGGVAIDPSLEAQLFSPRPNGPAVAALLAVGLLVGAFIGARLAIGLPGELVQRAFGVLLVLVGIRLALFVS